jgi:hypothetical protein
MASTATNTPSAIPTGVSQELEDRIMSALPKEVTDWVRYEANADVSVTEIFRAWRAGTSTPQILAWLRGEQRKETRQVYGASHPQAAFV